MKVIALGLVSALCLTLCTSCGEEDHWTFSVVGEWSGPNGRSMIFYHDGRVAIRDAQGVEPDGRYEYDDVRNVVKITRPEGASTLRGELHSKNRLRFEGRGGKPMIFQRRGT
jgi:hypothetical protein